MAGVQYIVWRDEYEVGHGLLDGHHQHMFEIINTLYEAARTDASQDRIDQILRDITEYAHVHFQAEEDAMDAVRYSRLSDQESAHKAFVQKLDELRRMGHMPYRAFAQETLQFLKEWWLHHILAMDQDYGPYLHGTPAG